MKAIISSYKKAQVFKKDYVRKKGAFVRFQKTSGNHSHVELELNEGDEFDARASAYREGITQWNAASTQSWAKFKVVDGELKAFNFDGKEIPVPHWISFYADEEKTITAPALVATVAAVAVAVV